MTIKCVKNSLFEIKFAPRVIVRDRHALFKSAKYKTVAARLSDLGTAHRKCKPRNPKDKGHIERWFDTLKSTYLNYELGYIGDGIKSKRKGGRANLELTKQYSQGLYAKSENEIIELITLKIQEYNNKKTKNNQSPEDRFQSGLPEKPRYFEKGELSYVFLDERYCTVKKSKVIFTHNLIQYVYTIYNKYLADKINLTRIRVRYNSENLSTIDIFEKESDRYLGTLNRDRGINIILETEDRKLLKFHSQKIKERIHNNLDELKSDIEQGWEELKAIPIVSIDDTYKNQEEKTFKDNVKLLFNNYPYSEKIKKVEKLKHDRNAIKFKNIENNNYKEISD